MFSEDGWFFMFVTLFRYFSFFSLSKCPCVNQMPGRSLLRLHLFFWKIIWKKKKRLFICKNSPDFNLSSPHSTNVEIIGHNGNKMKTPEETTNHTSATSLSLQTVPPFLLSESFCPRPGRESWLDYNTLESQWYSIFAPLGKCVITWRLGI